MVDIASSPCCRALSASLLAIFFTVISFVRFLRPAWIIVGHLFIYLFIFCPLTGLFFSRSWAYADAKFFCSKWLRASFAAFWLSVDSIFKRPGGIYGRTGISLVLSLLPWFIHFWHFAFAFAVAGTVLYCPTCGLGHPCNLCGYAGISPTHVRPFRRISSVVLALVTFVRPRRLQYTYAFACSSQTL